MPVRKIPFVTGEYYHVFNRGVEKRLIFSNAYDYRRFLKTINFYRFSLSPLNLSRFLKLSYQDRKQIISNAQNIHKPVITLICFVFMPNHFHFLLRQDKKGGVSKFVKEVTNSYSRYFNTRHNRVGHLFQGQFKAVRIVSQEQLLHISRYIHLNPYTSYIVKDITDLDFYKWSSFSQYINNSKGFCDTDIILSSFNSEASYKEFVYNQANYQRELENIKHLIIE